MSLHVAGHVEYKSQEHGGVLILDTAAEEWIALNQTAGDLWRSWESGAGFDAGVRDVADRYPDVPRESIKADARQLLAELTARRISTRAEITRMPPAALSSATDAQAPRVIPRQPLTDADVSVPARGEAAIMAGLGERGTGPAPGWFRIVMAMMALGVADIVMRCSFRTALALVRFTRRGWHRHASTPEQAARTVAAVGKAALWYPGRAACLEQSLAAVLLAAAARRRLDWCIGSVPDPYRFHAWVALAGQPVPVSREDSFRTAYEAILCV